MRSIGIIGHGVVGRGLEKLFKGTFRVGCYDKDFTSDESINLSPNGINRCDLGIICVPTPSKEDGSCNLSAIEEVLSWLETPLILIKSTIPPGTIKYLRDKYKKNINFSPEYMGESSYFTPYWKYPDPTKAETHTFVIVGGNEASQILEYFMKVMSVDTKYMAVSAEEAEMTKYMENAFFATKVTFCNEFANIAKQFGVDYKKLRELWLLDSRINPNHTMVFDDKKGFGGKCLPKDLKAIVKASENAGYEPTLLKEVIKTNDKFIHSNNK